MSRHLITIWNEADRIRARKAITDAPVKTRVEFHGEKRSNKQNDRMFEILGAIAKLEWHGQYYTDMEWKDYFMHALRGEKWMPFEEGGMIPIGRSTSKLKKADFSDLMALMEAFCARQNISLPWDQERAA